MFPNRWAHLHPRDITVQTWRKCAKEMGSPTNGGKDSRPLVPKHGKIINCKSENVVPIVVPRELVETSPRSDADEASGDQAPTASGDQGVTGAES